VTTWHALLYKLKPGTEDAVAELFATSGRPEHEVLDDEGKPVGTLLRTVVFVGREVAVRVIEVEGHLPVVAAHMSRQEPVREFERAIEEHLAEPRDMVTPEGARRFFVEAGLRCVLNRTADT
jgi:hypothetical protein